MALGRDAGGPALPRAHATCCPHDARCRLGATPALGFASHVSCHPRCPSCAAARHGRAVTGEAAGRADELIDAN